MVVPSDIERLLVHADWLNRLARRLVAEAATAEDLVQETWVAALRRPPDSGRPARPWLSSVIRRLAALRARREGARSALRMDVGDATPAADEALARLEQERALAGHVLALEEPYRSAVLLRYYRGLSAARIARELGLPPATVRTHVKRGLERLRARLDRSNGGDGRSWTAALAPLCGKNAAPATVAVSIGGGFTVKAIAGVALVAAAFMVLWWSGESAETPASMRTADAAHVSVPDADPEPFPPTERFAEPAPRVALVPETAVAPPATKDETGLIVRAVRRDDGAPLPAVRGYLEPVDGPGGRTIGRPQDGRLPGLLEQAEADASGVLRFSLPPERRLVLNLSSGAREIGTLELQVAPLEEGELREVLAEMPVGPDVHFVGRVVDDVTGAPLADVEVVVPNGWSSGGVVESYVTSTTDAGGYFSIDGLSWERQHVEIDAPGYGLLLAALVAGHDSRETAQELRLLEAATLEVRTSGRGGVPLPVEVRATTGFSELLRPRTGVGDTVGWDPRWSARSGSDGRAVIAGMPPGVPIELEIWREGGLARRVAPAPRLAAGEARVLELSLENGTRILGEALRPNGAPVVDLEVWLRAAERTQRDRYFTPWDGDDAAQRSTTDARGRFTFEDVPPGSWLVGPACPRDVDAPFDASHVPPLATFLRIAEGSLQERVVLEVSPARSIRGRVVDAEGEPGASLWVRLTSRFLDGNRDYLTREDGGFVAEPLAPGRYRLVALGRGDSADAKPVWAEAGAEEEVLLVLEPAAEIRGRVVDGATGEGRAAELRLISALDPGGYVRWKSSTREGDFRLESLEPGPYHLLARSDDGGIALLRNLVVARRASIEDVEVRLEPGAILVVSAPRATEDCGFSLLHDGLHAGHGFVGPAKTSEQVLLPGRTEVHYAGQGGHSEVLAVDVVPGERRELSLPPLGAQKP